METINNSQEQNEALDHLHPYGQYVLVNTETGSVVWFEDYNDAVRNHSKYGGSIINTATADPEFVQRTLANARRKMNMQ